jgi:hypothetical protein
MPVEMLTYAALGDRAEAAVRVAGRSFVYPIDCTSPHPPRGRCPRCESARPGKRQRRAQHRRAVLLDAGDIDRAQRQLRRLAIGFAKSQGE